MYNGVGLQTTRGTGTSGHVQRNIAAVRRARPARPTHKRRPRQVNAALQSHEARRKVEVAVAELEEELSGRGYEKEQIRVMTNRLRSDLVARDEGEKQGERDREIEEGKMRRIKGELLRPKQGHDGKNKFRDAFGVDPQYKEGDFLKRMKKKGEEDGDGGGKVDDRGGESVAAAAKGRGDMDEGGNGRDNDLRGLGAHSEIGDREENNDGMVDSSSSLSSSSSERPESPLSDGYGGGRGLAERAPGEDIAEGKKRTRDASWEEKSRVYKRVRDEERQQSEADQLAIAKREKEPSYREEIQPTDRFEDSREREFSKNRDHLNNSLLLEAPRHCALNNNHTEHRNRERLPPGRHKREDFAEFSEESPTRRRGQRRYESYSSSSSGASDYVRGTRKWSELRRHREYSYLSDEELHLNGREQYAVRKTSYRHWRDDSASSSGRSLSSPTSHRRRYRQRLHSPRRRRSYSRKHSSSSHSRRRTRDRPARYRRKRKSYSDDSSSDSDSYHSRSPQPRRRRPASRRRYSRGRDRRRRRGYSSEDDDDSYNSGITAREQRNTRAVRSERRYTRRTSLSPVHRYDDCNAPEQHRRRSPRGLRGGREFIIQDGDVKNGRNVRRDGYWADDERRDARRSVSPERRQQRPFSSERRSNFARKVSEGRGTHRWDRGAATHDMSEGRAKIFRSTSREGYK